jgi:hypothetical protein
MLRLPPELKVFVDEASWTFAKTYAQTWPHEYIVRDRVDEVLFFSLVSHIRKHGYEGRFYRKAITYFSEDGMVYWTMGAPLEETTIVNRCREEQTYEYRLKHDALPGVG